jgi:hypothetical protein
MRPGPARTTNKLALRYVRAVRREVRVGWVNRLANGLPVDGQARARICRMAASVARVQLACSGVTDDAILSALGCDPRAVPADAAPGRSPLAEAVKAEGTRIAEEAWPELTTTLPTFLELPAREQCARIVRDGQVLAELDVRWAPGKLGDREALSQAWRRAKAAGWEAPAPEFDDVWWSAGETWRAWVRPAAAQA